MKRLAPHILLLVLVGFAPSAWAQYHFGKNKVQYAQFDWRLMRTEHFDVYFYPEAKTVAEIGAALAEASYDELQKRFGHTLRNRIPLILYSSMIYFQQTNTTPGLLPEGVQGFMDLVKGRVVVPYDGSVAKLRHAIRHELVHVFMYSKLRHVLKKHNVYNVQMPPLWFTEGLAEYWSAGWNSEADMILKDAVFSDRLASIARLPGINGSMLMYKEGQSILRFIGEQYGEDKIRLILENWWISERFDEVVQSALGRSLAQIDNAWRYDLKKRYYPGIAHADPVSRTGSELTSGGNSVKPAVICSQPPSIVYLSNETGYCDIYQKPLDLKARPERLVKGERSDEYESLHLLSSKLSVSCDGILAFVSKSEERDHIYLWDIEQRRLTGKLSWDELVGLSSPAWSPDGRRIALSGQSKAGEVDLYVADKQSRSLLRVTHDIYDDRDPAWTPGGRGLVFSSDRTVFGEEGFYNLFTCDVATGAIEQLTLGRHNDYAPAWSPDGTRLAFSSDRDGAFNLHLLDASSSRCGQLTHFLTGAVDPAWLPDGESLVFSGYEKGAFQLYHVTLPDTNLQLAAGDAAGGVVGSWRAETIKKQQVKSTLRYRKKFSLDLAQSNLNYDPELGTTGGLQFALTDVLGDHHYYVLLANDAHKKTDFLKRFSVALTYVDLSRKSNLAWGVFHVAKRDFDYRDGWVQLRRYGGFVEIGYPLSKFRRVEGSFVLRKLERTDIGSGTAELRAALLSSYAGYTKDTTLWGPVGPIDGQRYNITLGYTTDLEAARVRYGTVLVDLRHYLRLARRSCLAFRTIARASSGREAQDFSMGGSWTLRGYSWNSLWGHAVFLTNAEWRFPLIDRLLIGFPFGNVGVSAFRGAVFVDAGRVWEGNRDGLLGALGCGLRVRLSDLFVIRFDLARRTNFKRVEARTRSDVFFGWSF